MTQSDQAFASVAHRLSEVLRCHVEKQPSARVHGGCINDSYRWECAAGAVFVKVAPLARLPMLEAEAEGLRQLDVACAAQSVPRLRIPRVLSVDSAGQAALLALEWIDFATQPSATSQARLGEGLAHQHRTSAPHFGWHRANTIGSTPQLNAWTASWPEFFRDNRLRYQLALARDQGYVGRLQQRGACLVERLPAFFSDHDPRPSLLHGDLWGGNFRSDAQGRPVIFDPAVYYGDREADLAMTRLFGGFSREFYSAYQSVWPLSPSAHARTDLYNLYHVLNHLNLFGASYQRQAEAMIDGLLALLGH